MPHPLERAEIAAFQDMFAAVPPDVAGERGFELREIGGAVCGVLRSRSGMRELNHVLGATAATDLDAVRDFYRGTEHIVSTDEALVPALVARGYVAGYAWMKFVRAPDAGVGAATDLRVEAVGAERAEDFTATVIGGFGLPPFLGAQIGALPGRPRWRCFVAYDGTAPVGGGALYIDGDQGWLGFGATLPEARRRGAQGAILAARLRHAAEAGCAVVTTETGVRDPGRTDQSYRNILRAGFEEAFVRPNWVSPPRMT